ASWRQRQYRRMSSTSRFNWLGLYLRHSERSRRRRNRLVSAADANSRSTNRNSVRKDSVSGGLMTSGAPSIRSSSPDSPRTRTRHCASYLPKSLKRSFRGLSGKPKRPHGQSQGHSAPQRGHTQGSHSSETRYNASDSQRRSSVSRRPQLQQCGGAKPVRSQTLSNTNPSPPRPTISWSRRSSS